MKYLKQKLMAAVAMLAVSTVMLTSASYAWFTISVTPEVQNITVTATTNENFEIALGTEDTTTATPDNYTTVDTDYDKTNTTGDNHHWGAIVTFKDLALTGLGPAELNGGQIKSTEYGSDGRPAGLQPVTQKDGDKMTNGTITLYDVDGNPVGQKVLLWLRSNKDGKISVEISGVKFGTEEGNKVELAFEVVDSSRAIVETNITAGKTAAAVEIGDIVANTATQVYMYVYLEGANVTNKDVATAVNVTINNIKFTNSGITAANAYNNK